MSDRMVLRLSQTWAVLADDRQWMLCRRRTKPNGGWKPVSFVATTKTILLRCIREKGAVVDPEGQAALDRLPDSFRMWKKQMEEASPKAFSPGLDKAGYARKSMPPDTGYPAPLTSRYIPRISPQAGLAESMDEEAGQ